MVKWEFVIIVNILRIVIRYCQDSQNQENAEDHSIEIIQQINSMSQKVIRVLDFDSLQESRHCNFSFWKPEIIQDPKLIGKIFEYLRTASVIRLYITKSCIEYSAETSKHGFVCGSCHRNGYMFFEFGLSRSGHRFDIYEEDRKDPTIKAFYEWWENLVKPYEEEFDKDFNL